MALVDFLARGAQVALDTNSLIYYVEQHLDFSPAIRPIIQLIQNGDIAGHVSVLSLMEVLVLPSRSGDEQLAAQYRDFLSNNRLILHNLTPEIAELAAELRARYRLTTPDAIVGATALQAGCTHLVTNDSVFRAVPDIEVLVIREHAP
ncbi:MAG: type II toxin-antitoxin system VapC family toxin [Dehalococcoidia bacterium]